MSILIKGMEMPKRCYVCPFCDYVAARCDAVEGKPYTPKSRYEKRADFCPLVPVPPHHGRLIDADALYEVVKKRTRNWAGGWNDIECVLTGNDIKDAPTIVPADPAEEGE